MRGAVWTLIHTAVSIPIAFGVNVLLARILGVADYGRLALLTAALELTVLVAGAGVSSALIQFGSKAHAAGRTDEVADLLRRTQGFRLLAVAPTVTSVVIVIADVPAYLLISAIVFGIWLPAFTGGAAACMTLENRTATGAKLAILLGLLTQGAVVATLLVMPTADAIWNARMIVGGLGPLLSLFLISPLYRRPVITPKPPHPMPLGFWRYALPIGLSAILANLALSRSEVFLLEALSTPTQVGLYAMAFGLATHVLAPAQAFVNPLVPAVSGLRETSPERIGAAALRTVRVTSTLAGAVCAVGAPTIAILVPFIYGEAYSDADWMVLALIFIASAIFLSSPLIPFVTSRLRGGRVLLINTLSLIVGVSFTFPAVLILGAWGAVVGKGVIAVTRYSLLLVLERSSFGTRRSDLIRASAPLGVGILVGLVLFLAAGWLPGHALMVATASFTLGILLYLILLRVCRSGLTIADANALSRLGETRDWSKRVLAQFVRLLTFAR